MKRFSLILLLSIMTIYVNAQVYVKSDAQGANNGKSWQDAFTNLDSALSKTISGQIWVAKGIYKPTVNSASYKIYKAFNIRNKIGLYGGFSGVETTLSQRNLLKNTTVLSGDIGVAGNDLDNTPIVVQITGLDLDSTTVIDGFTVTNAYYRNGYEYQAGAVYIYGSGKPVVRNCTVTKNFGWYGSGIYIRGCEATIANNTIIENIAFQGAGIYNDYGSTAQIINNRIIGNQCIGGYSHLSGGGIQIAAYSSPTIYGNLIDNNYAGKYGGGIANESNYSAVISNNVISNNTSEDGGGIYVDYSPTQISNNLVINNQSQNGGGVYVDYSPNTNSLNNTFSNNSAKYGGAVYATAANMNFINTIIYKNPSSAGKPIHIVIGRKDWFPKFEFCDIENGKQDVALNYDYIWGSSLNYQDSIWKNNNISIYPAFTDSANCNYQLSSQSNCVNMGIQDTLQLGIPPKDLSGNNRISNDRIDIGCYEYNGLNNFPKISVTPKNINLNGWSDSTFVLSITSNTDWYLRYPHDVIKMDVDSGSNNSSISVTVFKNPSSTETRTAKIFVSGRQVTSQNIPVVIAQTSSSYLFTSADTLTINSQGNNNPGFTINSDVNWYITSDQFWLSYSKFSGSNTDHISLSATANTTEKDRKAILKVYNYIGSVETSRNVVVIQKAIVLGINKLEDSDLALNPNPVEDNLTLTLSKPINHTFITIYSITGNLLYSSEFTGNQMVIDMSRYDKGCYLLKVSSPMEIKTYKILKR